MKRSKHSLSHYNLLSMDMGELVPVGLTEVLPGDTVQQATSALVRLSPLLAPVMHPVHVRIHHWFVPHRIIWEDFENFITGGPDGADDSEFPTLEVDPTVGSLADYLGVPTQGAGTNIEVSALPFRAYAMIFNEWYRDQDLVNPLDVSIESGFDTTTSTVLQNVAWEKDYFTSSRPWEQKGPAVELPFTANADVRFKDPDGRLYLESKQVYLANSPGTVGSLQSVGISGGTDVALGPVSTSQTPGQAATISGYVDQAQIDGLLEANMQDISSININDLREAFALQRYQEARARYGSRYTEYLRYLGVRSSDARLQRPEYLGGGRQTIQFSEVLQTAPGGDGVGGLYGHGIGALRSNRYRRFFEEHGYIVSMISVKPKTIYTHGLSRTWLRRTKEDFFQKELQHIGQQEVYAQEIYGSADPDKVFGYQDRYDEYRRSESRVSGEFRTSALEHWHMAREFANEPALNADFIKSTPTKRIFAEQAQDSLYVMVNHSIQARRLVSKVGSSFIF